VYSSRWSPRFDYIFFSANSVLSVALWMAQFIHRSCQITIQSRSVHFFFRMRVMNHNWSARKQCLHLHSAECSICTLQSAAGINHHSALSENGIWQCGTSSESRRKDRSVSISRHFLLQALQCPCSLISTASQSLPHWGHWWHLVILLSMFGWWYKNEMWLCCWL